MSTGFMKLHTETNCFLNAFCPVFAPLRFLTSVNQPKVLVINEEYSVIIGANILVIRSDMKYRCEGDRVQLEERLEGVDGSDSFHGVGAAKRLLASHEVCCDLLLLFYVSPFSFIGTCFWTNVFLLACREVPMLFFGNA